MSDDQDKNKLSFEVGLQDIINLASRAGSNSFIGSGTKEDAEAEAIKKAWFEHMLLSIEKLQDQIDAVRRVELKHLKDDLDKKIDKIEARLEKLEQAIKHDIEKVEASLKAHETEYKDDKKTVIDPIKTNLTKLSVKMTFYGMIGGVLSSAVITLVLYMINEWVIKRVP